LEVVQVYQLMTTVSVLIDDIRFGVETLCRTLGVPEPRPQSYRSGPGVDAVFMRVNPKYAVAPTFLELISPGPDEVADAIPISAIAVSQAARPIKWHATELAMPEQQLHHLADRLKQLGVYVAFFPSDRRDRFFLGGVPGSDKYDPGADGGLLIEAGRSGHLGLPDEAFTAPADIPPGASPETMVRIVAREYLVSDLDTTLRAFERNLQWVPTSITDEDGCRRAILPFSVPRSAQLELLQPTGPGRVGDAYDQLGPGAWTVRVSVVDVASKARDLEARGTPFTVDGATLRPDPRHTLQVPFEFVAARRPPLTTHPPNR
jgi:hypothetical protein